MKSSLLEVIDMVLQRLEGSVQTAENESSIRVWLAGKGYSRRDIDAAMRIVFPQGGEAAAPRGISTAAPMRQLAQYEFSRITPEARSALARLDMHGLIEPREREFLIERLMQMEGDIDLDTLDFVLSTVFCTTRNAESQSTLLSTMEGYGPTLH